MFEKLKAMFGSEDEEKPAIVPGKCLVDIELSGRTHTFFQPIEFVEKLEQALPAGGFFAFTSGRNCYLINLKLADRVEVFDEAIEIMGEDQDGYSVWLSDGKKAIGLGVVEQNFDHICVAANDDGQFIQIGRNYFNRDDVALIVLQQPKAA